MKISDLYKRNQPVLSAEVFPPKESGTMEGVIRALKAIKNFSPDFVSITYGAGGKGSGSTADVASVAFDAFGMETVAHLTCVNMTEDKLEAQLETLKRKGIYCVLALRGDLGEGDFLPRFTYASELTGYIKRRYPEFSVLGACYPEGHYQASSLSLDIDNLKRKIDAGAEALITQLFFDNAYFRTFSDKIKAKGITVPMSAGIMPVTSAAQIKRMVSMCGASIPEKLAKIIARYSGESLVAAGIEYAAAQAEELAKDGADGIHVYTMNRGECADKIFGRVRKAVGRAD